MDLTKDQTHNLLYNRIKIKALKKRFKFTTKFKYWCLCCQNPIYISYKQSGIYAIFCDVCYPIYCTKPTIVQYQYMRVLKEQQLNLFTQQSKFNFEELNNI